MLNKFSKIVLFYFAYLPLLVILAINNISNNQNLVIVVAILVVSSFLLTFLLMITVKDVTPSTEKITVDEMKNTDYLSFIVTYVIPFLVDLSGVKEIVSFAILFLIIAYLYMDTSLFSVNPLLKIFFRYNIYNVSLNEQKYYLLSKENYNKGETVSIPVRRLDKYILLGD